MLIGLAIAAIVGSVLVAYPGYRLMRPPRDRPSRIRTAANASQPLLLCLGDSITHGHVGGDWVGPLRERLAERGVLVANGGINGQQAWNLGQRLDDDLRCRPAAVVLLIGSNDVMAAERPSRAKAYRQQNRLPQTPDLEWSRAELTALVERLHAKVERLALCTIPPLGADPQQPIGKLVAQWNETVAELAQARGIALLDLHAALQPLNHGVSRAYEGAPNRVLRLVFGAAWLHYVLGRSWDAIARAGGWGATVEGIHLSDRAAERMGALVQEWVEGLGELPRPEPAQ